MNQPIATSSLLTGEHLHPRAGAVAPLSHAEVIDAGKAAEPVISALLAKIVAAI